MTDVAPEAPVERRSTALRVAITLAVAFGLATAVLGVKALADGDDGLSEHRTVRRVAGQFGEALLTYDFENLDANRERVLALATGGFEEKYAEAFEQGLASLIREAEASSTATVSDVFLSEVDEGTAEAVVVADLAIDGAAGSRTAYDVYFKLELVEVGGEWKVDDVVNLNFNLTGGGLPTGSTTTTSPSTTSTAAPG